MANAIPVTAPEGKPEVKPEVPAKGKAKAAPAEGVQLDTHDSVRVDH